MLQPAFFWHASSKSSLYIQGSIIQLQFLYIVTIGSLVPGARRVIGLLTPFSKESQKFLVF